MEEHVVVYRYVSAAKGKLKVKRQREVGDKLEDLRSELDSLTSLLPLEESEELGENLSAELDRLLSLELQEPEEAGDLEEAKEQKEGKESVRALDGLINGEVSRPKTVQAWYHDLLQYLRIVSALPKVTHSTFYDARKLFCRQP